MIIVFEGLDKSGKTTGIYNVEKYINLMYPHLKTKILSEVGSNSFGLGDKLKPILKNFKLSDTAQFYFFAAIRTENKKYLETLSKEYVILLDRYYFSTMVYQSNVEEYLTACNDLVCSESTLYLSIIRNTSVKIDSLIYFYAPAEIIEKRIKMSNKIDELENKILSNIEKWQKKYTDILDKCKEDFPIFRINTNRDENEVKKDINHSIDLILKGGKYKKVWIN